MHETQLPILQIWAAPQLVPSVLRVHVAVSVRIVEPEQLPPAHVGCVHVRLLDPSSSQVLL